MQGDASTDLRVAVGRLAGKILRSEITGIRDVVLALRGVPEGGSTFRSRSRSEELAALALIHIEYLEALTEATWGFRKEIERLLTSDPGRTSQLVFAPTTLELARAGRELEGRFGVENTGAATIEVELAHGPIRQAVVGEAVEGLRVELSPSAFEVPPGATVNVAVRVSGAEEIPPGEYRTRLLSLRDLRWPVEVVIQWRGSDVDPHEAGRGRPTAKRRPRAEEILAPARGFPGESARPSEAPPATDSWEDVVTEETPAEAEEPAPRIAQPVAPKIGGKRAGRRTGAARPTERRVDLATSTVEEIARLDGVSHTLAVEIVATRERLGGVLRVDDLLQVRGVGPKLAEKIAEQTKPP